VEITPEGGDCTRDERGAKFVTKVDDESHTFGFTTRTDGVCFIDASWSDFYVKVTDSAGHLVGDGTVVVGHFFPGPTSLPARSAARGEVGTGSLARTSAPDCAASRFICWGANADTASARRAPRCAERFRLE
jgi:hypothetical protein